MKRLTLSVGAVVLALAAVVLVRGIATRSRQVAAEPAPPVSIDAQAAADRLAEAIRFRTVSYQDRTRFDQAEFIGLRNFLERAFPRVHQVLGREVINDFSLLYTWPGREAGRPIVLLAHLDVVPVEPSTEPSWTHLPFAGAIDDGYVWGRGTLDDKGSAVALLEAVEYLLDAGVQPTRTVYLAFGHDEEVNGEHGAGSLAATLRERGVSADFVLDEGGWLIEGLIPGIAAPVASICVGEKGYASVELVAKGEGGHSSMPPAQTSVGELSAAIARLEASPMPPRFSGPIDQSFTFLGPEMGIGPRLVFANLWLFGPLVERAMAKYPEANAAIRTTTAPTMFDGGVKENVLPTSARAVVNFRILPGDTVQGVVDHVRDTIQDPTIALRLLDGSSEPSPLSDPDAPPFTRLARIIRATFQGTLVAPFVTLGATDARYYAAISPNLYRFLPMRMRAADLARIHGTDERVAVEDYAAMIRFYIGLLRSTVGDQAADGQGAVTRAFTQGRCMEGLGCDPG